METTNRWPVVASQGEKTKADPSRVRSAIEVILKEQAVAGHPRLLVARQTELA